MNFSAYVSQDKEYTAEFIRMNDVTFNTHQPGLQLKVRDTLRSDGFVAKVLSDDNTISAEAVYQVVNRVQYTFLCWQDYSAQNPRPFQPSDHASYTAIYMPKPLPPAYVSPGGSAGDYVHVTWQQHPDSRVTQ
jgi:hypothetical protein